MFENWTFGDSRKMICTCCSRTFRITVPYSISHLPRTRPKHVTTTSSCLFRFWVAVTPRRYLFSDVQVLCFPAGKRSDVSDLLNMNAVQTAATSGNMSALAQTSQIVHRVPNISRSCRAVTPQQHLGESGRSSYEKNCRSSYHIVPRQARLGSTARNSP